ncbi:hypothetical protein DZF91_23760, partial [Actinomadura logoneensis]
APARPAAPAKPAPKPVRAHVHRPPHPVAASRPRRHAGLTTPLIFVILAIVISAGVAALFAA